MPLDDQVSNQPVTAAQAPATSATPATPASPSTPPAAPAVSPASGAPDQNQMVSNAGPIVPRNAQDPNLVKAVDGAQLQHPAVQRAGLLHSVAQALAGNPTRTVIDSDGTHRTIPAPASTKSLMMAIALEALQGSLTGLAAGRGRGPGAAGLAAMQQAQQQKQQEQQRQEDEQEAQFGDRAKSLAQQASAYAANLRTRALAQEIGARDEEAHRAWVAAHASTVSYIRNIHPDLIIKDNAAESEITTPEFTRQALQNGWIAVPSGYELRYDGQGNHFTQDGVPMHNNTFTVVDGRQIKIPADVVSKAQQWNLPGFSNFTDRNGQPVNGLQDAELRIGTIMDTTNKVAVLEQEQRDLDGYYGYLASKGLKGSDGKPVAAPDLKTLVRQTPSLTSYIVGPWANHFGETPSVAFKAMKDNAPAKGPLLNLYGGQQTLDKYDLFKDTEKKTTEKSAEAAVDIDKERKLIPVKAAAAGAEAKAREQATQPDNLSDNEIVNGMLDGTVDITKTASIRGNQRERYISLAKQRDPNFNMQTYGLRLKLNQDYISGKQGDQIQSFNVFMQHAADASDVTDGYRQTKSPLINKSLNWLAKNATGDPGYSKFVAAIEPVRKEFATFLEGGHALTESDKHAANTILSDDSSPAQIQAALKQMAHTGSIRLGGLDDRYRATFGHSYQGLLYPDTITAASKLGLGGFAAKYSGGQSPANTRAQKPPAGATVKVPGSDGKMHWSDGKQDLGVVQ